MTDESFSWNIFGGIIGWPNGKIDDMGMDFGCPSPTHSSSWFLFQSNAHE